MQDDCIEWQGYKNSVQYNKATMYRHVEDETEAVQLAYTLQGIVEHSPNWKGRYCPESTIAAWQEGRIRAAIINEEYLLLYAVAAPWYNDQIIELYELGLYRIRKGGRGEGFKGIDKALQCIASQYSAERVVVGTSLPGNKEALARLYRRAGYKDHAIVLFKETQHGG